jgi:hypothetical protein
MLIVHRNMIRKKVLIYESIHIEIQLVNGLLWMKDLIVNSRILKSLRLLVIEDNVFVVYLLFYWE